MPSQLRYSTSPSAITESTTQFYSLSPPQKRQKMSLTQTYYLAHTARAKLSREAARADHDLRLLVGHANLLDGLMLDLADAEREQESWFNQSVKATKESEEPKHIQWADSVPTVVEDYEEESSDDESEASDDEQDISYSPAPLRRVPSPPTIITTTEMDIDSDEEEDEEEDEEDLVLRRISSRSPPELLHESDSDSEDDTMPPSPPYILDSYSEKQRQVSFFGKAQSVPLSQASDFYEEGYYLPQRQPVDAY